MKKLTLTLLLFIAFSWLGNAQKSSQNFSTVYGAMEKSITINSTQLRGLEGCGQTQVSNNFEEAFLIQESGEYKIADDFIVSASTLNLSLETITANMWVGGGIASVDVVFYNDNGGVPGSQIGATIQDIVPTSQLSVGNVGGFDVLEVVIDLPTPVDFARAGTFDAATYWVQLSAAPNDPSSPVGWEMSSVDPINHYSVIKYQNDPWLINTDGYDAVFSIDGTCTMVACPEPTGLLANNITQTSADISWTPGGIETEWELEYGSAGFVLGTGTVITDNDGTLGENISGLEPATYYEYYVTALCGPGGDVYPGGPAGFSTLCGGAITAFPFVESFETSSGTRDCWTNEYVDGAPTDWKYVTANGNNSITPRTGALMAQYKIESFGETTKLVTPVLDLTSLTSPQLTFYFANSNWIADHDELRIYYKTSTGGAWTQIGDDFTTEHTVWTQIILDLPNPSAEYYVAFEGKSNFGRGMDVDDVMIAETPACVQPLNLIADHMTNDSVELSWDNVPNATNGYEWFVFTTGADPTTATPVATGTTPSGTLTTTVTGLSELTLYDFYVRTDCDAQGISFLAGPITFKTADLPLTCGDNFYDTGGASGDYSDDEFVTTIISPDTVGEKVTVTFTQFDVEFGWDALYVHDGPDATYPLIDSGNGATANFPPGGYYGQTAPGPFTSAHSSGALTFVFMSDSAFPYSGWEANVTCSLLSVADRAFENFTYYPNPVKNSLVLNASNEIENVKIFNLLGQEVLNVEPNSSTPTLEMGSLKTGVYLMKVTVDKNEETFRIIKE